MSTNSRRGWKSVQERLGWDDDRLDQEKILYHLNLLADAGYIRVVHKSGTASGGVLVGSLDEVRALHMTMDGHDLLEALKGAEDKGEAFRSVRDAN